MDTSTTLGRQRLVALRVCVTLAVLLIGVAIFTLVHDSVSTPAWQHYPSGTAPNAVAHFLEDLQDGSLAAAYRITASGDNSRSKRSLARFDHQFGTWQESGHKIGFERVAQRAKTADVVVRIGTEYAGSRFSPGYTGWQRVTYRLIRRGAWRIQGWKSRDLGTTSGAQTQLSPPS